MPCDITITFKDGSVLEIGKKDYQGFKSRPASWEIIVEKFNNLSSPFADRFLRQEIIDTVKNLETFQVSDLMVLLEKAGTPVYKTLNLDL
jgi:2-methylcitrate dehydratase